MPSRRVRFLVNALLLAAPCAAGAPAAWAQVDLPAPDRDAADANAPVMLVTPTPPSVAVAPSDAWPLAKPAATAPAAAASDSAAPVSTAAGAPAGSVPASVAITSTAPGAVTEAAASDASPDDADAQDAAPAAPLDLSLPSPQLTPAPRRTAKGAAPPAPAPAKQAARPADPRLRVQASVGFNAGYLTSPVAVSADIVGGQSTTPLPVPRVTDGTPTPLLPDQRVPDREVAIGMSYTLHQNGRTRVSLDGSVGVVTYGADPDRPADSPYKPVGTTSIRVSF